MAYFEGFFEIKEVPAGYEVIDTNGYRWLATFKMFADAAEFAKAKVAARPTLESALGDSK